MPESYTKKKVDWPKVTAEVNRRLGKDYAVNYLQNIWNGLQKSAPVLEVLNELLPDVERPANG